MFPRACGTGRLKLWDAALARRGGGNHKKKPVSGSCHETFFFLPTQLYSTFCLLAKLFLSMSQNPIGRMHTLIHAYWTVASAQPLLTVSNIISFASSTPSFEPVISIASSPSLARPCALGTWILQPVCSRIRLISRPPGPTRLDSQ